MKYNSEKRKSECVCGETTHIQNIMRLHIISRSSSCITDFSFSLLSNVCFKHLSKAPDDKLFTVKSGAKHPQRHQPWKDQVRGKHRDWGGRSLRSSRLGHHCVPQKSEKQCESCVWKKERPLKTAFPNALLSLSQPLRIVSQSSRLKAFLGLPRRSLPQSSLKAFWF